MATGTTRKTATTARKSAARPARAKAAAPAKASAKTAVSGKAQVGSISPAKPAAAPVPKVVKVSEPAVSQPDMKKKDLIDAVVTRSGLKKKDAKPVIEATLAVLGEALAQGQEFNLQPLGKLRINRSEEHENYRIIVCKLRQQTALRKAGDDPLAAAAE